MNSLNRAFKMIAFMCAASAALGSVASAKAQATTPAAPTALALQERFENPPREARPQVYWFWMGTQVSQPGITRDLEALKDAGFGGTTLCHLSDICTPWAQTIGNAPPSDVISYQSDSWWKLIRFAAAESRRLGLEFGLHNCPGYESSGGPWITPELSMQEIVWSQTPVKGPAKFDAILPRPQPDLHADQPFPIYNGKTGVLEKPIIPARRSYYGDIAVLALPSTGIAPREKVLNLTAQMDAKGHLTWDVPAGDWIIYRFGHTTTGTEQQPGQGDAIGLECDKMSQEAVEFHLRHLLGDAKKQLGDLFGNGLTYIWFDSYEAGTPNWTPKMMAEFSARRKYDMIPMLATFAKRTVGSDAETKAFQDDFQHTVHDLYRDCYFATIQRECHAAGIQARSEPYTGPWNVGEAIPYFDQVSAEFWTRAGKYSPMEVADVVAGSRAAGNAIITAEAFTGLPRDSQWNETPEWLKPMGDAAFCDGINRLMLHRFVHQPYDDKYQPGVSMGQWGTHFDRTQTWWEPGKAWVKYLQRTQAVLQWGKIAAGDVTADTLPRGMILKSIHRTDDTTDAYFVANLSRVAGSVNCSFALAGKQPELWNPVTGVCRDLPEFQMKEGKTIVPLDFAAAQSTLIIFRKPAAAAAAGGKNFPTLKPSADLQGPWQLAFDPKWGGPAQVTFDTLADWITRPEPGIKYYSGTATYSKTFALPASARIQPRSAIWLDLGTVHALASVRLNGSDLGVVWTAPWRIDISAAIKPQDNKLEIKVTNVWANRLIGDEQEPADCQWSKGDEGFGGPLKAFPDWFINNTPRPSANRFTFTTWNYFTKSSPLVPSGLLGPVRLLVGE